jgi:serine O-acetyltransferase
MSLQKRKNLYKIIVTLYSSSSIRAIVYYRLSKYYYQKGNTLLAIFFKNKLIHNYGTHISLKAEIGENLSLRHVNGVVIGDGVQIGGNVIIYQQVTIGGKNIGDAANDNYPIIEDNVTLFAGSKILGSVKIGKNSIVGANSVVINDVPENCVVAGVPAKVIKVIDKE